jgi:hypothetical protein
MVLLTGARVGFAGTVGGRPNKCYGAWMVMSTRTGAHLLAAGHAARVRAPSPPLRVTVARHAEEDSVRVVVDEMSALYLAGCQVDYHDALMCHAESN